MYSFLTQSIVLTPAIFLSTTILHHTSKLGLLLPCPPASLHFYSVPILENVASGCCLANVCVRNSWGSPNSVPLLALVRDSKFEDRGHDWRHREKRVAGLLATILLLSVSLWTRIAVLACSITCEFRRHLCSEWRDVGSQVWNVLPAWESRIKWPTV